MGSQRRHLSRAKAASKSNSALIMLGAGILAIVAALIVGAIAGSSANAQTLSRAPVRGGSLSPAQYVAQFSAADHLLLDVRTRAEFQSGHIAGATNIPVEQLAGRLAEVPRDRPVVVYCRSGNRSAQAARLLRDAGYESVYDLGGLIAWQAQGHPIQR